MAQGLIDSECGEKYNTNVKRVRRVEIDVSSIKREVGASLGARFSEEWNEFTWGGEEIKFAAPVTVELVLTNTGERLVADGTVRTKLILACSRCLELFPYTLHVPFVMGYQEAKRMDGAGLEESVDLDVREFSGDRIDIREDVRETLFLALPMKALCREDCPGLCQYCGKNLDEGPCTCQTDYIDPRLEVLRDLFKQEK